MNCRVGKSGAGRPVSRRLQESRQDEMMAAENKRSGLIGDPFGGPRELAGGLDGTGISIYCNVNASLQPRTPNLGSGCPRRSMNTPQGVHKPPEKVCIIVCLSIVLAGFGSRRSMVLRTHPPFFSTLFSVPLASAWVWPIGSPARDQRKGIE